MPLSLVAQRILAMAGVTIAQDFRKFSDERMGAVVDKRREVYSRHRNGHIDLPAHRDFIAWAKALDVPVAAILPGCDLNETLRALGVDDLRKSAIVEDFFARTSPEQREELGRERATKTIASARQHGGGPVAKAALPTGGDAAALIRSRDELTALVGATPTTSPMYWPLMNALTAIQLRLNGQASFGTTPMPGIPTSSSGSIGPAPGTRTRSGGAFSPDPTTDFTDVKGRR